MKASSGMFVIGIVLLPLGGCMTNSGELLHRNLLIDGHSQKEPRAVVGCIGLKWASHEASQIHTIVTQKGYIVSFATDDLVFPEGAAGVEPEEAGSRVKFAVQGPQVLWFTQDVMDCM